MSMTGQNLRGGGWRNHADIKRRTALRALSTVEANEKWRPYSPSRPSNRGYLPLCYDSKTPLALSFQLDLWTDNYTLRHSRTVPFHPFYTPLFISPLLSPSLFFHIVQASYRRVGYRAAPWDIYLEERVHFYSFLHTVHRMLDTVSIAWRRSLLPRINLVDSRHEPRFQPEWISGQDFYPSSPQSFRFDKRNLRGEIRIKERKEGPVRGRWNFRDSGRGGGMQFVEREFRKCTRLSTVSERHC